MAQRYALIVGIDNYTDAAHFIPLPFAQADAHALYELLIDPERGGWSPEDVTYLAGEVATRDDLMRNRMILFSFISLVMRFSIPPREMAISR